MRLGPRTLCAWAFVLGPAAWAQAPTGPAFQVNSYTTGVHVYPLAAMEPDGDFLVIWDESVVMGAQPDVHARRFGAGGVPIGGDFRVNAFTDGMQSLLLARFSVDARGNAVIVWSDSRGADIYGRRVSAQGVPLGDDFRVNTSSAGFQAFPTAAVARDGRFVVVWQDTYDVFGRRFDAFGNGLGEEFRVNSYVTAPQERADAAIDAAGNFTVVWHSYGQDGAYFEGIFGQRFDVTGARLGGEFQVNTYTTGSQRSPSIAMRGDGSFIVAWFGAGEGSPSDIWARRYSSAGAPEGDVFRVSSVPAPDVAASATVAVDEPGNFVIAWAQFPEASPARVNVNRFAADGTPRGAEFQVAAPAGDTFVRPSIASDAVGNFTVAWYDTTPDGDQVFGRRFGGLFPAGLALADGGNGVLEVPDDFSLNTSWRNLSGATQTFQGRSSNAVVPAGLVLTLSPSSNYGTVAGGAVGSCSSPCFAGGLFGTRPPGHVDLSFVETIVPDVQGQAKRWVLHVGGSFTDLPRTSAFYRFVETLLHRGVTSGCAAGAYCPGSSTTREQMAVFVLVAREGVGYVPPACTTPVFADVPASSPFCRWIEELARRGVTGGCGGGNFCPGDPVAREQMAVFVLRALDPALNPPACTTPIFNDVPASSPFCRWIEELVRRGVVAGCGGANYCPGAPVIREQMAVFLTGTFGLTLYGP